MRTVKLVALLVNTFRFVGVILSLLFRQCTADCVGLLESMYEYKPTNDVVFVDESLRQANDLPVGSSFIDTGLDEFLFSL